jgi:hypothetical protein
MKPAFILVIALLLVASASAITIDTVTVDDSANPSDIPQTWVRTTRRQAITALLTKEAMYRNGMK